MKNRLKKLRQMALLSQFQLAKQTGISRARISLLENGDAEPTAEEVATIVAAVGAAHQKQTAEFAKLAGANELRATAAA
jgi:transcriptional regulator with XRE-family HTH domain